MEKYIVIGKLVNRVFKGEGINSFALIDIELIKKTKENKVYRFQRKAFVPNFLVEKVRSMLLGSIVCAEGVVEPNAYSKKDGTQGLGLKLSINNIEMVDGSYEKQDTFDYSKIVEEKEEERKKVADIFDDFEFDL